jgi:hypothetical protein
MRWRCSGGADRERSQWVQGRPLAGQQVEQRLTGTVGKGVDPLPNGRACWPWLGHLPQQATQAQPGDEVEMDSAL